MKKPELLAPAGDLEKLKIAALYGADAVYFGGELFSLRAGAGNMSLAEMTEGIAFCHAHGVKCYLAMGSRSSGQSCRKGIPDAVVPCRQRPCVRWTYPQRPYK